MNSEEFILESYSTMLYEDIISLCNYRCFKKENLEIHDNSHNDCMVECSKNEMSYLENFKHYLQARAEKSFRN